MIVRVSKADGVFQFETYDYDDPKVIERVLVLAERAALLTAVEKELEQTNLPPSSTQTPISLREPPKKLVVDHFFSDNAPTPANVSEVREDEVPAKQELVDWLETLEPPEYAHELTQVSTHFFGKQLHYQDPRWRWLYDHLRQAHKIFGAKHDGRFIAQKKDTEVVDSKAKTFARYKLIPNIEKLETPPTSWR